jgi:phosphoribosylamine-glycine ligase
VPFFCGILLQANDGWTAAIEAAYKGKEATLKILVDGKADLDAKVRREGGEMLGEDGGGGAGGAGVHGSSVDIVPLVWAMRSVVCCIVEFLAKKGKSWGNVF